MQTERKASRQDIIEERRPPGKLDPAAFGLTCGVMWGTGLFALTWWIMAFEGPSDKPTGLGRLYRGYTVTPAGSVIGLVWGFFDALCGGLLFAWVYNWLGGQRRS